VAALLIAAQFLFSDGMEEAWSAVEHGGAAVSSPMVWLHVVVGVLVLLIAAWRIKLRLTRGVPDAPEADPAWQKLVAHLTHLALYALMILLTISGAAAWFGGVVAAGGVHQLFKMALIVFVVAHAGAALFHQFWLKDHLLLRMMRAQD
jgi:cytochrome b561